MDDEQEARWYADCLFEQKYKRSIETAERNLKLWLAVFEEEGGISFESRPYDHVRECEREYDE